MAIYIVAQAEIFVGAETLLDGPAPSSGLAAFFEDDGDSGYFYAADPSKTGNSIEDAVLIYAAGNVIDRHLASTVKIGWSSDGQKVALLVNGALHAVFDFRSKQGFCRTGFPLPSTSSSWTRPDWTDSVGNLFS